jgi:hypothetical protein
MWEYMPTYYKVLHEFYMDQRINHILRKYEKISGTREVNARGRPVSPLRMA